MARIRLILDGRSLRGPDLATIDRIARLQLACRSQGFELRLRHASAALTELIELTGLGGVLCVEPLGEAEEREEACRVEEERELPDPPA